MPSEPCAPEIFGFSNNESEPGDAAAADVAKKKAMGDSAAAQAAADAEKKKKVADDSTTVQSHMIVHVKKNYTSLILVTQGLSCNVVRELS